MVLDEYILMMNHRGDLTTNERKSYIAAVQCLMKNPSKLPAGQFPGATNRYEDFVVIHMQQTLSIHGTVRYLRVEACIVLIGSGKFLVVA